jgi:hypothetical protein
MSTTPQAGDPVEVVAGVVVEPVDQHDYSAGRVPVGRTTAVTPTQLRRPWRATVRTFVQTLIPTVLALGVVVPEVVKIVLEETGDAMPDHLRVILLGISAACATTAAVVARVMAIPKVETLLRRFKLTSWLAAAPSPWIGRG